MIEAEVSVDALIKAAEQLSERDLGHLATQVLALSARRKAPSVTGQEAELLLKINQRLPADVQRRYDELIAKRDAETLTPQEHAELIELTREAEALDVARVVALIELAAVRGVPMPELRRQLELEASADE
jgi:hypothetical protein